MKGFQVGVLIFFGLFVFIGILIFSGAIKLGSSASSSAQTGSSSGLVVWGTVPAKNLSTALSFLNTNKGLAIKYVEKDPRTYESDILNAFAFGGLPDMFLLSQDLITTYKDKILSIPFTYFSERTYDDSYIRAANVFKTTDGFLGFPIFADPLVMYYNQDILESAGLSVPPKYWSELFNYVPKLVNKNEALEIKRAGVALGEFSNIENAKSIFSALLLQLNDPIVARDATNKYSSVFSAQSDVSTRPALQSLDFYREFSDPLKNVYTWNKTLPEARNAFISGDLAIYFGFASEFANIKAKNPNLNFDVAMIPQVKELNNSVTYSKIYALAIPKSSPTANTALSVASALANGDNTVILVGPSGYSSVRRDLLASPSNSKYSQTFAASALVSRSWIDPNSTKTDEIFSKMIEDVISGLASSSDAVTHADTELKILLAK